MIFPYFPQNTKHVKCFLVIFVSLFHEAWCQAPNGALLFHPNPSGWLDPWRPRNHSDSYIYYRMILIINRMSKNLVYLKKLFSKWSMYAQTSIWSIYEYICIYIYKYIISIGNSLIDQMSWGYQISNETEVSMRSPLTGLITKLLPLFQKEECW